MLINIQLISRVKTKRHLFEEFEKNIRQKLINKQQRQKLNNKQQRQNLHLQYKYNLTAHSQILNIVITKCIVSIFFFLMFMKLTIFKQVNILIYSLFN